MESSAASESREWLAPFLPLLGRPGDAVLDLGCGRGQDAAVLVAAGLRVTGCDRDLDSLLEARSVARGAAFFLADASRPLPVRDGAFAAVLASLSLHYLAWDQTLAAFGEVRRVLVPGGLFLFRVNATDDENFGASSGVEVEHHLRRYPHGGADHAQKRFFDERDVRAVLAGRFEVLSLEHVTTRRWGRPKRAWVCLARALPQAT